MEAISNHTENQVTESKVDWEEVIGAFPLSKDLVQIAVSQFITSHAVHIRNAIQQYTVQLDSDPVNVTLDNEQNAMQEVRDIINKYFGVGDADDIAITESTTMGLGMLYTGLNIPKGKEILITDHAHYSHYESVFQSSKRSGASFRQLKLYENIDNVSTDEIISSIIKEIKRETRILGLTWVHSDTGLKIPIADICQSIHDLNSERDGADQVKVVVDGVHGFGIEMETFKDLACDFFVTSCHKWMYGPRGTGFVAGRHDAWQLTTPVIPSFSDVMNDITRERRPMFNDGKQMTPGGYKSFEYKWAMKAAFEFMMSIGKQNVFNRVHELNRQCKEGLSKMSHVRLITPMADELSSGIISFEVDGMTAAEVVSNLKAKRVVSTESPYKESYARFTPGIINSKSDVDKALDAVYSLKK
jgi:isopenicillin-N epimerase